MLAQRKTRKFTPDEYQWMGRVGILCPDERVELLDGVVVIMSPMGPRHNKYVNSTAEWFTVRANDRFHVWAQSSIRLPNNSEPELDVVLLKRRADGYETRLPGADDVLLLIEAADSSIDDDRDRKIPMYARAGIAEVWLEDLTTNEITVHRDPVKGEYQSVQTIGPGNTIAPLALPDLVLRYEDIFS